MKILFLGAAISNHTLRWVNSLADRGHEILLVCRGDQKARDENIKISEKVKVHYLRFGGGLGYYLNTIELRKVYGEFRPDIVNAHYATGYGTLARIARVKPLVLSFWGSDIYYFPFRSKSNKKMLYRNIKYADTIAATSVAMSKKIKEVYPHMDKDVYVTPFGIDTNLFKPIEKKKNERPIIGIVKYLKPIYDIPLLINAFAIIKKETNLNPLLYIYGGGFLLEELKQLCKTLGVEEDVFFWGTIPNIEIPSAINNMDIFVNCSITESFGVALLEAMACEVPVVATDAEGYKEVVNHGVTGIILKDREPKTRAYEIIKLLKDSKTAKEYGINGRRRVVAMYNWEKDVSIMEKLYVNTINKCKKVGNSA